MDRKDAIVRRWREGIAARLASAGEKLRVVRGEARYTAAPRIEVDGQAFEAPTINVDVGGRAALPRLSGLDAVPFLDNASALDLRALPSHLVVLGGGYIVCELGQMFRRFGAEVTILDHGPRLLAREDDDVSAAIEGAFRAEGIRLELGVRADGVRRAGDGVAVHLADGREVAGSHLLVATGRVPNTEKLGCDAAGVKLDERGFILTGDDYATSAPGVFAVGDVTGGPRFTHALVVGRPPHPLRSPHGQDPTREVEPPHPLRRVHGAPGGGRGSGGAAEPGSGKLAHEMATMPFDSIARAIETDQLAGTMKVLIDPSSERVLGCRIVGAEAGELIHVFVALMASGASARAFVEAEAVHPTFSEGLQSLLMRLARFSLA